MREKGMESVVTAARVCMMAALVLPARAAWADAGDLAWTAPETYLRTVVMPVAYGKGMGPVQPAQGDDRPHFQRLVVTGAIKIGRSLDALRGSQQYATTIINDAHDGTLQQFTSVGGNGLVGVMSFSTTYAGMPLLRWQVLTPRSEQTDDSVAVASAVKQWTPLTKVAENSEYDFRYDLYAATDRGKVEVIYACHTGHFYDATLVNAALGGKAIDISCNKKNKEFVTSDVVRVFGYRYLMNYGVGLLTAEIFPSQMMMYFTADHVDITP